MTTPLLIYLKQPCEDFFIGHVGSVVIPTVGDGCIEFFLDIVQPCEAGVVEVGQGALFQIAFMTGFGDDVIKVIFPLYYFQKSPVQVTQLVCFHQHKGYLKHSGYSPSPALAS